MIVENGNTGIRFNLDIPTAGNNLKSTVYTKGEIKNLNYNPLLIPLYFVGSIRNKVDGYEASVIN